MNHIDFGSEMKALLGATMVLYVALMYGLSFWVRGRIHDAEDFVVAGRRLPLSLAWMTLLATWFGAGTLLAAADEARKEGVQSVALDPWGAGVCLLLAGMFVAAPLWRMGLLTVSDFFRQKFGVAAEVLSACFLVPSYIGWIAAQFVALAGVLELFFGMDPHLGIVLVALVGMGYTLLGGMWSVTLTDALQISLLLLGLIVLVGTALSGLGSGDPVAGMARLFSETPPEMLAPVPTESFARFSGWMAVLCVGALGNLPGQDLLQRVFAAKSAQVARRACFIAGFAYLAFGTIPVTLGLIANLMFPEEVDSAILPALAHAFLHPVPAVIFTVAIMSAVLSTIDSAILSPASVLAQNILGKFVPEEFSHLLLNRLAVVLVTAASVAMAYLGEDAYSLLEEAYSLMLVGLFVPLVFGIYTKPRSGLPAIAAMIIGGALWGVHYGFRWEVFLQPLASKVGWYLHSSMTITVCALLFYLLLDLYDKLIRRTMTPMSERLP